MPIGKGGAKGGTTGFSPDQVQQFLDRMRQGGLTAQVPDLQAPQQVDPGLVTRTQGIQAALGGIQGGLQGLMAPKANALTVMRGTAMQGPDLSPGFGAVNSAIGAPLQRSMLDTSNANQRIAFQNQQATARAGAANQDLSSAFSGAQANAQGDLSLQIAKMQADALRSRMNDSRSKLNSTEETKLATIQGVMDSADEMDRIMSKYQGKGGIGTMMKYATGLGVGDRLLGMLPGASKPDDSLVNDAQQFEAHKQNLAKESLRLFTPGRTPSPQEQDTFNKASVAGFDPGETDDSYAAKQRSLRSKLQYQKQIILQNHRLDGAPAGQSLNDGSGRQVDTRPTQPRGATSKVVRSPQVSSILSKYGVQ